MEKVLVTGDMGFIGQHLKLFLEKKGYEVVGADIKNGMDLRIYENAVKAVKGIDCVYHLAADVGGIGYLSDKNNARNK